MAHWMELTWTAMPSGLSGLLEFVEATGARTTLATYVIEAQAGRVKLTWQHQPDAKATPTMFEAEVAPLSSKQQTAEEEIRGKQK